jgi:hypothetical protein
METGQRVCKFGLETKDVNIMNTPKMIVKIPSYQKIHAWLNQPSENNTHVGK